MIQEPGHYLQALRRRKGVSLQDAAAFAGITPAQLAGIESGRRYATRQQLLNLAGYFGVDENRLLIAHQYKRMQHAAGALFGHMQQELSEMMNGELRIKVHHPSPQLDHCVESMVYYEGHNFGHSLEIIQPDGTAQLIFELEGAEQYLLSGGERRVLPKARVTGIQERAITCDVGMRQRTLIIRFRPGGLYAVTGIPQHLLKDGLLEAAHLFGPQVEELREKIMGCTDPRPMFAKAEAFLLLRLQRREMEAAVVRHVSANIFTPFPLLVKQTGYSQKHLIDLFKKHVGASPKFFHRLHRYCAALNDILAVKGKVDWSAIIHGHQYYDQAHFIREFRQFSGHSPTKFLETGSSCPKCIRTSRPISSASCTGSGSSRTA